MAGNARRPTNLQVADDQTSTISIWIIMSWDGLAGESTVLLCAVRVVTVPTRRVHDSIMSRRMGQR